MSLTRCISTNLLKKRNLTKLFVALLLAVFTAYMVTGKYSVQDGADLSSGETVLRQRSDAVMERRMLNANEDSMEALRAPTTATAKLGERVEKLVGNEVRMSENNNMDLQWNRDGFVNRQAINAPIPADSDDRVLRQTKKMNIKNAYIQGDSREKGWNRDQNFDNAVGNNLNNDGVYEKTGQISSSTSSTTTTTPPHIPSPKHDQDYYDDYEQIVKKKAEKSHQQKKADKNAPAVQSKVDIQKQKMNSGSSKYEKKPAKQNRSTKTAKKSQTSTSKPTKRAKVKQWETYDYENPNNLLQIHVDRAPEHSEGVGSPWPMPQSYLTELTYQRVDVENFRFIRPASSCDRVDRAINRYQKHINSKIDLFIPEGESLKKTDGNDRALNVLRVALSRSCRDKELPHEHMSEQYRLIVNNEGAVLSAQEPWGVIRGLETFSQLLYYEKGYAVINNTVIKDYPRFRFRGLMLDTARHYIPIRNIKRTMDVMSYNKMNVFHWHLVDDQSFPFVSKVFPLLSKLGAYSTRQIYSQADVLDLIDYAADRAIRVIPEFDSPGHTRSWGLGYPKLLTNCSADYHPFGAVNPISNYTYEFMNKFWAEVRSLFPDSTVHVGGDEINYKCWLRLKAIREFMLENNMTIEQYDYQTLDGDKLQGYYLKHLLEAMPKDRKKIAWEEAFNAAQIWNVSMDELIINVWKGGDYEWQYTIENVIRHGYKAILSAPWYLNYISYGRDWTKYYEQDPHSFLTYSAGADMYKDYVLGGQVCMWSEFIDESNLEATLWPRASAPAEKFWSSARMNDWRKAEIRFENHRCRMFRRGVHVQPNSGPGSCKGRMRIKPPYDANTNFF